MAVRLFEATRFRFVEAETKTRATVLILRGRPYLVARPWVNTNGSILG